MSAIDSRGIHVNAGSGLGPDFGRIGVSFLVTGDRQTDRQTDKSAITKVETQFYRDLESKQSLYFGERISVCACVGLQGERRLFTYLTYYSYAHSSKTGHLLRKRATKATSVRVAGKREKIEGCRECKTHPIIKQDIQLGPAFSCFLMNKCPVLYQ